MMPGNGHKLMQWDGDGAEVPSGTVTFFFMGGNVSVRMESFREAHQLHDAIQLEIANRKREYAVDVLDGLIATLATRKMAL